ATDGIRDFHVTGVQTCAIPIWALAASRPIPIHEGWGLAGRAVSRTRACAAAAASTRRATRCTAEVATTRVLRERVARVERAPVRRASAAAIASAYTSGRTLPIAAGAVSRAGWTRCVRWVFVPRAAIRG